MFKLFRFSSPACKTVEEEEEYTETIIDFDKTQRIKIKNTTNSLKADLEKLLEEVTGAEPSGSIN